MYHDWSDMAKELSGAMKEVRGGTPDVMKAFSGMAKAALEPKALDTRTKELVSLAIAVAIRCDGCIAFHAKAAVDQGASREEVIETIGTAIYMGAGPSVVYGAQALEAFEERAGEAGVDLRGAPPSFTCHAYVHQC